MARTTIDKATVERYIREGLTQQQMVERFYEETGERRSRSSFAAAIMRYNVDNPRATPRYSGALPWEGVPVEHYCYEQRMLRALGSREEGRPNQDVENGRLDAWLEEMDRENLVVMWEPSLGFFKVPREPDDVGYVTIKNLAKS
jgi:hypothetical protein